MTEALTRREVETLVEIDAGGAVTAYTGKVELGTGVATALSQIVAEELDVPFGRVRLVSGDTRLTPDQGTTAGSKTIQVTGVRMRQAAADLRHALVERASARLGVPAERLEVIEGVVRERGNPGRSVDYGSLAAEPVVPVPGVEAPVKSPSGHALVGTSVPRVDLLAKVTGGEAFVHDLRLAGMLHGRVLRPYRRTPGGAATVEDVDERALAGIAGVVAVVRRGNFLGVVAEREEQAVAAAAAVRVTWSGLSPLPDQASEFDRLRAAAAEVQEFARAGNVEDGLASATARHETTFRQSWQAHASLGPSCAVADVREDGATIWSSSQHVHSLGVAIAPILGLPPERVHMIFREGAGCYGQNGADDVSADAAILSQATGKPVRVQWSRQEEFAWEPKGTSMVTELRGGLDEEGNVVAWEYEVWTPTHSNRPGGDPGRLLAGQEVDPPFAPVGRGYGGGNRNAPSNYAFPNNRVAVHWTSQPTLHQSSVRTLGGFHNATANEVFMDELAVLAEDDPVAFRLRHLTDPRAVAVVEAVAALSGWEGGVRAGRAQATGGPLRGRGIAFAQYENEHTYVATVASIELDPDSGVIRVTDVHVAHDCGLVINPDGLRNQIEGNVIQGISRALKEDVTWDAEGITSLTWADYPILTFSEVPEIEIELLNRPGEPPLGAGEPTICTIAAAINNAVYQAAGIRLRTVPYTPDRVLAALRPGA